MLPPVDQSTLAANPRFDALYRDLCTNKLNPDGSTVHDPKALKERASLNTELRNVRLDAARRSILRTELASLDYRGDALPEELQEVVAITAALLEGQVPAEDLELVQGYVEQLKENPSPVAAAIERRLNRNASTLSRIISPDTRLSLSDATTALSQARTSVEQSRETIAQARLQLATETYALHDLYRQVLATSIRLLEQTIHGSVARGTKAKAEYLALVAEGMAKKLGVQHGQLLAQVYSEDVQDTLKQRSGDARVEERAVRRKIDEAEDRLAQYRAGRGMEGMASEYAEILREMEKVKAEIARLEANKGR